MNSVSLLTDPVVTCPYNRNHRIALSKIQTHIVKCEKNYPAGYKETCPYNATHRLFKDELADHIQKCPQRRLLKPELDQFVRNHGALQTEFIEQSIAESIIDYGESLDTGSQKDCVSSVDGRSGIITPSASTRSVSHKSTQFNDKKSNDRSENLRHPRGYSEAMMVGNESDIAEGSDIESVISVMGVGRGRITPAQIRLCKRFSIGRGRSLIKNE